MEHGDSDCGPGTTAARLGDSHVEDLKDISHPRLTSVMPTVQGAGQITSPQA